MHLPAIAKNGKYCLLSLDGALWWSELLKMEWGQGPGSTVMQALANQAVNILSSEVSGIESGPQLGFDTLRQKSNLAGSLISLDKRLNQIDPLSLPPFYPNWGVEHIKNNYSLVSLRLAYHPGEKLALDKQKLVAEISDHCRYEGVDLLLEICLTASADGKPGSEPWQVAQLIAASELCGYADVLVLEYPGSALASATLTARLDLPWLLLDNSLNYATLKEQTRECVEAGASGLMIQGSIWQGLLMIQSSDNLAAAEQFISREVRDRVIELNRIVQETKS